MTKRKISDSIRLASVQKVLSGEDSMRGVARDLGIGHLHVQRWVALFEEHGEQGLFIRNRHYTKEFKRSVVEFKKENQLSLPQTAVRFCIPGESLIVKWERIYDLEGPEGLSPKKRGRKKMKPTQCKKPKPPLTVEEQLRRENELLRAEVAYLKKLRVLVEERVARESGRLLRPSKD